MSSAPLRIQILHVPDCPLVGQLRALVRHALVRCDLRAEIEEAEGAYPSPTLLVDGSDGAGRCIEGGLACRLDLPTEDQIVAALVARAK
ncbi:MAG: alkylmercury lyase [Acidimicrobiales bacterium]